MSSLDSWIKSSNSLDWPIKTESALSCAVQKRWKGAKIAVITIPQILNKPLTDEGARAFVEIIEKVEERTQKATLEMAETKSDVIRNDTYFYTVRTLPFRFIS